MRGSEVSTGFGEGVWVCNGLDSPGKNGAGLDGENMAFGGENMGLGGDSVCFGGEKVCFGVDNIGRFGEAMAG